MLILGIETASSAGGAALVEDMRVIAEHYSIAPRTHAERLLPAIDGLLRDYGATIRDVDLIAVSIGPGSFTGLRIGLATAKGLAFSARKPIVGVPTLDAFVQLHVPSPVRMMPVLDARKGEVFTALYDEDGRKLSPEENVKPELLAERMKEESPLLVMGDGARRYREIFEEVAGIKFAPAEKDDPRPATVALLGRRLFLEGKVQDVDSLLPLYIRRSDAELGPSAGIENK